MSGLAPCGTEAAYSRHVALGQDADDACRAAHAAYHRDYRAARPLYVRQRDQDRVAARYRALVRLGKAHPVRLDELVAELLPPGANRWTVLGPARTALAKEHPADYAALLSEERAKRGLT